MICEHLIKPPQLAIFDASIETKTSADSSKCGLEAALLQRYGDAWWPVAYASRAMSDAEQRYSQIKKEAMAITYGCEKFHQFVYGRKVVIETDHRPLIAIATKPMGDLPPRLQPFFLRLFTYDFDLYFAPGKQLLLADTLSRMSPNAAGDVGFNEDVEVHATRIVSELVSKNTMDRLAKESAADPEIRAVIDYLCGKGKIEGPLKQFAFEL